MERGFSAQSAHLRHHRSTHCWEIHPGQSEPPVDVKPLSRTSWSYQGSGFTYDAEWNGKHFLVMDTGGWDTRARGLGAQIAAQAKRALTEADAVAFVLDATVGATDADTEVARVLQRGHSGVGGGEQGRRCGPNPRGRIAVVLGGWASLFPRPLCTVVAPGDLGRSVTMLPETGKGLSRWRPLVALHCSAVPMSASAVTVERWPVARASGGRRRRGDDGRPGR